MEILDLLHPQDVLMRVPERAKRPLLEVLARRLASRSGMSAVSVLSALLGREKLGATAIGQGIGMPHAMLDGLREPAAVLAVLEAPIPYHAPDDQSVDVVLAVIWPRYGSSDFLTALARFCRRLSDPQVLKRLRGSASAEEALRLSVTRQTQLVLPSPGCRLSLRPGAAGQQGGAGYERDGDGPSFTVAGWADVRSGHGRCARMRR